MRDIVVMGAGGTAREVAALLRALNRRSPEWNVLGYVERDASRTGSLVADLPVLGSAQWLHERESETSVAFAIGTPAFIVRAHAEVADLPYLDYPNLIHPTVVMDEGRIRMGVGNVICAGNILTTDIAVGSFNYLNSASTFGHDMEIEDYCVVNPGC
ncbi:MAG: transferase, partial [Anaerolineae bacterium]|nr:transferase [Anaerolineae bacterium]